MFVDFFGQTQCFFFFFRGFFFTNFHWFFAFFGTFPNFSLCEQISRAFGQFPARLANFPHVWPNFPHVWLNFPHVWANFPHVRRFPARCGSVSSTSLADLQKVVLEAFPSLICKKSCFGGVLCVSWCFFQVWVVFVHSLV